MHYSQLYYHVFRPGNKSMEKAMGLQDCNNIHFTTVGDILVRRNTLGRTFGSTTRK